MTTKNQLKTAPACQKSGMEYSAGSIGNADLGVIAMLRWNEGYDDEMGRIFAAAPELLAALEELCADKYLSDPINSGRMASARAAIAKAKGAK